MNIIRTVPPLYTRVLIKNYKLQKSRQRKPINVYFNGKEILYFDEKKENQFFTSFLVYVKSKAHYTCLMSNPNLGIEYLWTFFYCTKLIMTHTFGEFYMNRRWKASIHPHSFHPISLLIPARAWYYCLICSFEWNYENFSKKKEKIFHYINVEKQISK